MMLTFTSSQAAPTSDFSLFLTLQNRLLLLICLLGLSVVASAQTRRYVSPAGTNTNPATATSWATATADLQGAINSLSSGEVWVARGMYKPTTTTDRTISFSMKDGVAIYGGFVGTESSLTQRPTINPVTGQPSSSTLSGNIGDPTSASDNTSGVVYNAGLNNTAILNGFIITAGYGDNDISGLGGGMRNSNSSPIIANCSFQNNSGASGGGMFNSDNSSPNLVNCLFLDNSVGANGGGMANRIGSSPNLVNCLFQNNSAGKEGYGLGGGMFSVDSRPLLTNCRFLNNSAPTSGGGMHNNVNTNSTLRNCVFQGNSTGQEGGGLAGSDLTLINCSFQNNSAATIGGGLSVSNGTATLVNCSFQRNSADYYGGAVANRAFVDMTNCVLFDNGGADTFLRPVSLRYSLLDASVSAYFDGGNNLRINSNPFVSSFSTQLKDCSPGINAGTNSVTALSSTTTDLAGNPRFYNGGNVDMGAYEYQGNPTTLTVTNPPITTTTVGQAFSQRFAASGGNSPYSFSVVEGSLPPGLSLATTGVLSGTLTQEGSFSVTVQATDANGCIGTSGVYQLTATTALPSISGFTATVGTVCVGSPATFTATVGNVTGSYAYTLTNGSSPITGSSTSSVFSQTLVTSGAGSQSFSLVVNNNGQSALASTALTVGTHPDYQPLVDLYNSTNGPGWANKTGWLTNCNPCGWYGVTCSGERVTRLDLPYNQLSGNLPTSLSSLTNLQNLALGNNQLSGSIPTSLGSLTNLQVLILSINQLSGSIPTSLGSVTNLQTLSLGDNQLSGSIPASLGSLTNLQNLSLQNNQLSGSIPASLGSLTNLRYLALHINQLSGSIPANLSNLTNIQFLYLYQNQLSGCYPASLTALCRVAIKDFTNNVGLPGGGNAAAFSLFCSTGQGSDAFVPIVTASATTLSVGGVVSLSTASGSNYQWIAPAGAQLSGTTSGVVSATLTSAGERTFTVVVGQGGTCSQTATVSVTATVAVPTLSSFAATSGTVCVGSVATFTATVGNVTGSYTYTLTNGSTSINGTANSGPFSQTLVASEAGNQRFTLTVSSNGQLASASTSVDVGAQPTATLTQTGPLTCRQLSTTLTAGSGLGAEQASYRFSTGATQVGTGNMATVNQAGIYSVTVSTGSGCSSTGSVTVEADQVPPSVSISSSSTTLTCNNPATTLTAVGSGTVRWSTGSTDPQISVSTAGIYSVSLTSSNGCSSTASVTVAADQATPLLTIDRTHTLLTCAKPSASLTAVGSGTVRWSTGSTDAPITVSSTGTYSVTLTSPSGCTATESITVNEDKSVLTVSISPSTGTPAGTTLTCANPTVTLTAVGTVFLRWNTGSTNPQISVSSAGTYSFSTTGPNGCTTSTSVTVSADQAPPSVSVTASRSLLTCLNPTATLTAVGSGTVRWSTNSTDAQITVSTAGIYSVTMTSPGGCTATVSTTITADQTPPALSISPSSATLTCTKSTATLTAAGTGLVHWNTGSADSQITVGAAGIYSVTLTSPNGCTASATTTVESNTILAAPSLLTQTGQSMVTADLNSGNVTLVASGCAGTINWMGSNNTSGTGTTILVPTTQPGTFTYQASCQQGSCASPAATVTVKVEGRVTVLHRDTDNYADNNAIQPLIQIQNQGSGALPLSRLTLRYYVTVENAAMLGNLSMNYAQVGNQNVRLRYVPLNPAQQGASGYVEYSFTDGAGSLAAGANSGAIQSYFTRSDYGPLNELDDYSYNPVRNQLTGNLRITAYYDGVLIGGVEPGSAIQVRAVRALTESKNGPSATQINTFLEVRNEGNVAINYSDLKLRYYFTSDGNERLQVEVDEGNVSAQIVTLATPLAGADRYLELSFNQSGQLAPGASTGTIRYRISKPDGGRFNQANDYSYQEQPQDRSQNSRVVVYAGPERVWGQEPGATGRVATMEPGGELLVNVLGNPVQHEQLLFKVTGAESQPLQIRLLTPQGRVVTQQQVPSAEATHQHQLSLGDQAGGVFFLQVSTPTQSRTVKVINAQ